MMLKVALTGGIGSGKTVVSDRLAALGAGVIDSDVVARALTAAGGAAIAPIVARFGEDALAPDGSLDRARMRARVFAEPSERQALEAITHPLIRQETARRAQALAASGAPYLVFAIPLLVESGDPHARFDRVLVIDCDPATQVARVVGRNGLPADQVRAIIATQASRQARLAVADDVLLNEEKAREALEREVDELHRHYLTLAAGTMRDPPH